MLLSLSFEFQDTVVYLMSIIINHRIFFFKSEKLQDNYISINIPVWNSRGNSFQMQMNKYFSKWKFPNMFLQNLQGEILVPYKSLDTEGMNEQQFHYACLTSRSPSSAWLSVWVLHSSCIEFFLSHKLIWKKFIL